MEKKATTRMTKSATKENKAKPENGYLEVCALNMCMVSLSQIVDYNDTNVLRQEYDAILNNLNMENFPKDEALLEALKRILDTCHFYLLHAKDKEMLKKKQEARLRGALGRALGGNSIVAMIGTPNPWAILGAAVTMVGVAAINYKSERAKILLENEGEAWELEKSALEQLHNLRKTLFETAWRLSKDHGFKDEYRLTESQISVYNDILSESDPLCRYERLYQIRRSFDAYPLFWYYLARAALETAEIYKPLDCYLKAEDNKISEDDKIGIGECPILVSDRERDKGLYTLYRNRADKALQKFIEKYDKCKLLREDVVAAAAYLDSVQFVEPNDYKEKLGRIAKAQKLAGMNFEVLQSCGVNYLIVLHAVRKSDDKERHKLMLEAAKGAGYCLRLLVNENFNADINGRALSVLYKTCANKDDPIHELGGDDEFDPKANYDTMKACIANRHSFVYRWMCPMSEEEYNMDWTNFFSGIKFKRTLARYMEMHLRFVYMDVFAALSKAVQEGSWSSVEALKDLKWGSRVKLESSGQLAFDGTDPKQVRHAVTWFSNHDKRLLSLIPEASVFVVAVPVVGALVASILLAKKSLRDASLNRENLSWQRKIDWRGIMKDPKAQELFEKVLKKESSCVDSEKGFLDSVVNFVNSSFENHLYTLYAFDHEREYASKDLEVPLVKMEDALHKFAEALALVYAAEFENVYENKSMTVVIPDENNVKHHCANPVLSIIEFFESYSESVYNKLRKMGLPSVCTKRYEYFPDSAARITAQAL